VDQRQVVEDIIDRLITGERLIITVETEKL
jgi:hypothetical protein